MTWLGGIVLGLGVLLVSGLAGYTIRQVVRRRDGIGGKDASYAGRLAVESENGPPDEINQTADALIREHGTGAVIAAAKRVLPTLDENDRKARAVWRQVLESAEERQRKEGQRDEAAE